MGLFCQTSSTPARGLGVCFDTLNRVARVLRRCGRGRFARELAELQKKHPIIGDVRQVGLHIGIEFVEDPKTKVPDMRMAQTVKHIALMMGLILGEAGYRMNVLKIKPPLIITTAEADEALAIFETAINEAMQQISK